MIEILISLCLLLLSIANMYQQVEIDNLNLEISNIKNTLDINGIY